MKIINHKELVGIVSTVNGATPITIVSVSDKGKGVTCKSTSNLMLGASYKNAVEKKEGIVDFTPQSLPFGSWLIVNKVVQHKDALYLRGIIAANKQKKEWFFHGVSTTYDAIEHLLPKNRESKVEVRCFKFDNIMEVAIKGKKFAVK